MSNEEKIRPQAEITRFCMEEVERQMAQIEKGEVKLIPGEEVFARIGEENKN